MVYIINEHSKNVFKVILLVVRIKYESYNGLCSSKLCVNVK